MTTIVFGPAAFANRSYPDTTANGIANTLSNYPWLYLTTETANLASGDYRALGYPSVSDTFYGYGFTYDQRGVPVSGTITEIKRTVSGQLASDIRGLSVPMQTFNAWVFGNYAYAAGQGLFGGSDSFYGTTGNEGLQGWGGNDTFYPLTGHDQVIGGSGVDTVVVPAYAQYAQIKTPTTVGTVQSGDVSIALQSVDRIRFIDGTRYYDQDAPAARVVLMYDTALGRAPDPAGLSFWTNTLAAGLPLQQMASAFVASSEFQARYPGVSQNPEAFVTQLYQNTLHRVPDPAGLQTWTNLLRGGTSPADVVIGFSQSQEHQKALLSRTSGVFVADEVCASAARLYYTTLGRGPDPGGLNSWTTAMESGGVSLTRVATGFMQSREFQSVYGSLSNTDFISLMYKNTLGRGADPGGFAAWSNALATGVSREQVVIGFSESVEHIQSLSARVDAAGVLFW